MHLVDANGARIPALGLGTWQLRDRECADVVAEGLRIGYRHLDTAQMYGNEREVGEGLRASGVARDDVFLTTKIMPDQLAGGVLERAAEERLRHLGVERVDLLLIHWPSPDVPLPETIAALNRVARDGLTRHIGVSNFNSSLVEQAVALSDAPIVVNQVEYHPYLDQSRLMATCRKHGLALTAYCPVARGRVFDDPAIGAIAIRHGRTAAQVTLRWLVQQDGVIAIPKTATPSRLKENLSIFDFELSDDEMTKISRLAEPNGRVVNAIWAPQWD